MGPKSKKSSRKSSRKSPRKRSGERRRRRRTKKDQWWKDALKAGASLATLGGLTAGGVAGYNKLQRDAKDRALRKTLTPSEEKIELKNMKERDAKDIEFDALRAGEQGFTPWDGVGPAPDGAFVLQRRRRRRRSQKSKSKSRRKRKSRSIKKRSKSRSGRRKA